MEKKLLIQVDNKKMVKNSEGNDVEVCFSLVLPYGVPFSLASQAIDELVVDFKAMEKAAEEMKKSQEAKPEENKEGAL